MNFLPRKFLVLFSLFVFFEFSIVAMASAENLKFDFRSFTLRNLTLLGDSYLRNGVLGLTREIGVPSSSSGSVICNSPVSFFDPVTNITASFSTRFSFSITNVSSGSYGDGLTFFLSPNNRTLGSSGGFLGLVNSSQLTKNRFVAVEFDTRLDSHFNDPNDNHIGLDIDTLNSIKTADPTLLGIDLKSGNLITTWIDYKDDQKKLNVWMSYSNSKPEKPVLSADTDLSDYLKGVIYAGFSASTEGSTELHLIQDWTFQTFGFQPVKPWYQPHNVSDNSVTVTPLIPASNSTSKRRKKLGLGFGIAGPAFFCVVLLVFGWISLKKWKEIRTDKSFKSELLKGPREFSYKELRSATKGFHSSRILGHGAFGTVYKAIFPALSSVYVFSAIYSGKTIYSIPWSSSSLSRVDAPQLEHALNFSRPFAGVGVTGPASQPQSIWTKPIWEVPPPGTKMPPLKAFRLTKELVSHRVKDNIIIVTFGNYAFMDFIMNWVKHLTDLGLSNFLVGAMDTKLLEALYWKGVPVFDMGSHMSTIDVGWGSPTFHKMGREKVILIDSMLPFGYELLMCDTDMVWLKNPLPYFARFPEADILTSSDQVVPTVVDDRLENWQQAGAAYNIGIFHWRPTNSTKKLAKEWKEILLTDEKIWDQNGFNELVRKQLGPSVDEESGLVYAYDGNLKLGILPASIFCSGHTYFVQAMHQQLRLEPYAVHTTFQYAGTEGKRHRLREGLVFYDEPEYYDSPGGFLSFKPSIPKRLLLEGKHDVTSHFSLVNYQIKQIRTALAIASLLNRTLVMPPLWCRLDRLWFGHPGILEGTMTRQPFLCPLDHVFEVNVMLKELPEEEFGPAIHFKEYSFLDNSLLPKQIKESWLDVQLCHSGSQDCHVTNKTSRPGVLRLPKHSSEETLKTVLSSFKDVKVIQFSSMQDAFEGFSDKTRETKFRNRMKRYVGIWCCVLDHTPGHIYYDMYWDEKPNWEPAPPKTPQDDHPPW